MIGSQSFADDVWDARWSACWFWQIIVLEALDIFRPTSPPRLPIAPFLPLGYVPDPWCQGWKNLFYNTLGVVWGADCSFFPRNSWYPWWRLFSGAAVGCVASCFVGVVRCSRPFCARPLVWCIVLLYLLSPKGGCCSISDDSSCSFTWCLVFFVFQVVSSKLKRTYLDSAWCAECRTDSCCLCDCLIP